MQEATKGWILDVVKGTGWVPEGHGLFGWWYFHKVDQKDMRIVFKEESNFLLSVGGTYLSDVFSNMHLPSVLPVVHLEVGGEVEHAKFVLKTGLTDRHEEWITYSRKIIQEIEQGKKTVEEALLGIKSLLDAEEKEKSWVMLLNGRPQIKTSLRVGYTNIEVTIYESGGRASVKMLIEGYSDDVIKSLALIAE